MVSRGAMEQKGGAANQPQDPTMEKTRRIPTGGLIIPLGNTCRLHS